MTNIRKLWHEIRRRRAIAGIRNHAAAFGYDLSDMTDDQIANGIRHVQNTFRMAGGSTEDVANAMEVFGRAWNQHLTYRR